LGDVLGVLEAHVRPGLAAVGAPVDAVAEPDTPLGLVLAGAKPDDVRVLRVEGDAPDRVRPVVIEDGAPGGAAVGRLPQPAGGAGSAASAVAAGLRSRWGEPRRPRQKPGFKGVTRTTQGSPPSPQGRCRRAP